jgi:hypothetical protein
VPHPGCCGAAGAGTAFAAGGPSGVRELAVALLAACMSVLGGSQCVDCLLCSWWRRAATARLQTLSRWAPAPVPSWACRCGSSPHSRRMMFCPQQLQSASFLCPAAPGRRQRRLAQPGAAGGAGVRRPGQRQSHLLMPATHCAKSRGVQQWHALGKRARAAKNQWQGRENASRENHGGESK